MSLLAPLFLSLIDFLPHIAILVQCVTPIYVFYLNHTVALAYNVADNQRVAARRGVGSYSIAGAGAPLVWNTRNFDGKVGEIRGEKCISQYFYCTLSVFVASQPLNPASAPQLIGETTPLKGCLYIVMHSALLGA